MTTDPIRLERGSLLALLDEAIVVARRIVPKLYIGLALPPALAAGAMAAYQGRIMRGVFSIVPDAGPGTSADIAGIMTNFGLLMLLFFVYLALISLSSAGIFAGAAHALQGRPFGPLRSLGWAIRPRVFGTFFIMTILVLIGFMFCLLPGLYLGLVWALTLPVMLWEESFGFQALGRSRQLVIYGPDKPVFSPGMGWVLLIGITVLVLSYGASLAVQLPLMIVQQVFMVRHIMGQVEEAAAATNPFDLLPSWFFMLQALSTFVSTLVQMLVVFFSASAFNLLYLRLKGRKEGHDLVAALDRLGVPE